MSTAPLSLGIDIGGTFTDLVIHDPRDGRAVIWKESTTPDDPARGALLGTRRVLEKAGAARRIVGRGALLPDDGAAVARIVDDDVGEGSADVDAE